MWSMAGTIALRRICRAPLRTASDPHDEFHANRVDEFLANRVAVIKPDRLWDAQPGCNAVDHSESVRDPDSVADTDGVAD